MRAGDLDRRIVIQTPTLTKNAYGESVKAWSTFATVWCNVRPKSGREAFAADQHEAQADTIFRIRWLSGVTTTMRISYDGKIYDIHYIAEIGRREGMDILAQAQRI